MIKKTAIRTIRKTCHISNKVLGRATSLTARIENKADRMINGSDFTVRLSDSVPLEKLYYANQKWITPLNPALPSLGQKASVVLLIPTLDDRSFYGGTATALIVAGRLAELTKKPLTVVQTLKTGHSHKLQDFFANVGIHITDTDITIRTVADRSYNVYGYLPMHPEDIYVASAWWDAFLLTQLPLQRKFVYLIQDFEPIFYNNSDSYILAESTYQKADKYIPLCNTKLMYDFMNNRNYESFTNNPSLWFEPAVSRRDTGTIIKKQAGEKKKLFLYGRPDVHRNLFFTGLNAIDYCFKTSMLNKDEWDICMAGQSKVPDIQLTSGVVVRNLGKMDMQEYIDFSKTVDLAVSPMMAPHPNYPTLEFASIGTAVVTTKYANKADLSSYSDNIVMCDIDVESMAGAIRVASTMGHSSRIDNTKSDSLESSWQAALDGPLKKIIKGII